MAKQGEFIVSPFRKELFRRDWRVRVGVPEDGTNLVFALDVTELDVEFEVEKDLTGEPNKCSVKIHNLPEDWRHELEQANIYDPKKPKGSTSAGKGTKTAKTIKSGHIRVEIEAGYKETGRALIFRGDLRRAISTRDNDKTWTTSIEGEDGGRTVLSSRVSESFPPGTPKRTVVERCASALGIGLGNIVEVEAQLATVYPHGTILDGQASKELAGVLRAAKLRYSIQDGTLLFLETGKGRRRKAVLLDRSSGLIGDPERDTSGLVIVTSLLNPDLTVGGYVYVDDASLQGTFVIQKITYSGNTAGDDWYAKCELKVG